MNAVTMEFDSLFTKLIIKEKLKTLIRLYKELSFFHTLKEISKNFREKYFEISR